MNIPIRKIYKGEYPKQLLEIPQVPKELYVKGGEIDCGEKMVSIVGAREHTEYGRKCCEKIIKELAGYPITIVSGLAIGIDTIAHESALQAGLRTVAIVGSGLDDSVLYPQRNKKLAYRIIESGGTLVSELPEKGRPARHTFPSRNRIMAGLSNLVIAIECKEKSGTAITMALASEYNRDVGAVPNSVFSDVGSGTNSLIQRGAYLIRGGKDVVELLGMEYAEDGDT